MYIINLLLRKDSVPSRWVVPSTLLGHICWPGLKYIKLKITSKEKVNLNLRKCYLLIIGCHFFLEPNGGRRKELILEALGLGTFIEFYLI